MKACPTCKCHSRQRLKRKLIVKIIPGSRTYSCNKCNAHYTWIPIINRGFRI